MLVLITTLHELGHIIGCWLIGIEIYGISFGPNGLQGIVGIVVIDWVKGTYTFMELLSVYLILPLLLELPLIYLSGKTKWWYVLAIAIHRCDILYLMSVLT